MSTIIGLSTDEVFIAPHRNLPARLHRRWCRWCQWIPSARWILTAHWIPSVQWIPSAHWILSAHWTPSVQSIPSAQWYRQRLKKAKTKAYHRQMLLMGTMKDLEKKTSTRQARNMPRWSHDSPLAGVPEDPVEFEPEDEPADPAAGPLELGIPQPLPPAMGSQAGVASPAAQSLIGGDVVLSRSVL